MEAIAEAAFYGPNAFSTLFCPEMDPSWTASLRLLPSDFLLGFARDPDRRIKEEREVGIFLSLLSAFMLCF